MWACALPVFLFFFVVINAALRDEIDNSALRVMAAFGLTLLIVFVIGPLMDGNWGPSVYGTGMP